MSIPSTDKNGAVVLFHVTAPFFTYYYSLNSSLALEEFLGDLRE